MSRVARVVVDVTGLDRSFDYLIPDDLSASVVVGARVRVPLHRREVAGWVVELLDASGSEVEPGRLMAITKVSSVGPSTEIVELTRWAAVRWASRRRPLLVAASPQRRVAGLPAPRRTGRNIQRRTATVEAPLDGLLDQGGGVVRVGPGSDARSVLESAASRGPVLVVAPTQSRAARIAASFRHLGRSTALYPSEWPAAAGGVDVVVGARSGVWASVPALAVIVVLDEHDDTLQEERAPTWHARDVAIERARRLAIPVLLTSPVPSITARQWAGRRIIDAADADEWPTVRVIDRNADDRWATSLVTSPLIELLRDRGKRVVCVLNVKGRARALACDSCRAVARCETWGAGGAQPTLEDFVCPRCDTRRPIVCLGCGSQKFRSIRVGVSRLRDELEAAAGRTVQEVTPTTASLDPSASVFVGTEAVLHRLDRADAVVFLDFDSELLAPRFRAGEQVLDLVAQGARLVAPTGGGAGGEVVVQTMVPHHELVAGLAANDLSAHVAAETDRRRRLRLPPFGALAEVSGPGWEEAATLLSGSVLVEVARTRHGALVRAPTWDDLSAALTALPKSRQRLRVAVDPARV